MFTKLLIILFIALPPALTFAANTKSENMKALLQEDPDDSAALYNLALIEQKAGNTALSLALAEKSLYTNPINFDAIKLKNLSAEKLAATSSGQIESVPTVYRVLDMLPYFLLLGVCGVSLVIFAYSLGILRYQENISFRAQPQKRLQSALLAAASAVCLALLFFKTQSQGEVWACVVSKEAQLFTGPSAKDFPQVSSLETGNCSKAVRIDEAWISLSPSNKSSGWTLKNQVLVVRGNKFDPLFKSD